MRNRFSNARRGFAVAIVLWAVAIAAIALSAVQLAAVRQSSAGREALARVRAQWAARAGLETMVADLTAEQVQAQPMGAKSLLAMLAADADGELSNGAMEFHVVHQDRLGEAPGASDAEAKININRMTAADLMLLPDMTEDIAAAIIDWIDADEEALPSGAELESYSGLRYSYKPRNGPIRDLRELELVRGVFPEFVRGEDWNLNGVLDPNENDGDLSWPPDDADGMLDGGWSQFITADSISGGTLGRDGQPRIDLSATDAGQLTAALGVDQVQADVIAAEGASGITDLSVFISTPLATMQTALLQSGALPGGTGRNRPPAPAELTRDQLAALLERTMIGTGASLQPGKININTVDEETLGYLAALDPTMRDEILAFRDQYGGDVEHFTDLLDVPQMTNATLATLYANFDVYSNTFAVTCRGVDKTTGITVEITATIDRSSDPVTIRSMLVR